MDYQELLLPLTRLSIDNIIPIELENFIKTYYVLIPFGIIAVWRWTMWLFKKLVGGLFYRPPRYVKFKENVSVISPVYNENPKVFARALTSWCANGVNEIIAVIDYTDKKSINVFDKFSCRFPKVKTKLLITTVPGKREALAAGIKAARSNIVALVDSDTVWEKNIKEKLLSPFSDLQVGAVAMRQDVLNPNTLSKKLFKIHLDLRFLNEMPYLAAVGDALMVISGRTAIYRKEAIINHLDDLVSERFMGKKVISGDDKRLTQLIQEDGWKSKYLKDVKVYTPGAMDLRTYLKQRLRWARNTIRTDIKTLASKWIWKREKPLAFYLIDRFIPPITLLFGPAFLVTALYFERYALVLAFLVWLLVSRFIKLFPHLREMPQNVLIIPLYILVNYFEAFGKIYAFLTMDEQGWITRWSRSRLKKGLMSFLRVAPSVALALAIPIALVLAVINLEGKRVEAVEKQEAQRQIYLAGKKRRAEEKGPPTAIKKAVAGSKLPSNQLNPSIEAKLELLLSEAKSDPYGYYMVKKDDSLLKISRLFNLSGPSVILDENKNPLGSQNYLFIGQKLAIPITELKNPLNSQLITTQVQYPLLVTYDIPTNTIFVRGEGNTVNLNRIRQSLAAANKQLLEEISPKEWILRANLTITKHTTLKLTSDEINNLKLKSDPNKHIWIKGEGGNILISKIKVTSWDETAKAPDTVHENGRSYITMKKSGRMDVIDSEISYLGYAGLPKRGGPFGGSYGLSWKIDSGKFKDNLLAGVVSGNKIHHNYFGLYFFGATGVIIRNNEVYENDIYGIDPHDDSSHFLIENNKVYKNGNHGIIASRRCTNNVIRNNESYDNKLHGIMLDRQSNNNIVENNTVDGNADGIAIYDSYNNVVQNNKVTGSTKNGVRINHNSANNFVGSNDFTGGNRGVYLYDEAKENIIFNNNITDNQFGITYKTPQRNQFENNLSPKQNRTDIYVIAEAQNYDIK